MQNLIPFTSLFEISKIKGINGKIDHLSLPDFVKAPKIMPIFKNGLIIGSEKVIERNLGNMISVNTRAIQQLGLKFDEEGNIKATGIILNAIDGPNCFRVTVDSNSKTIP